MNKSYSLVAAEIPTSINRGNHRSVNRDIVVQFVASGMKSARLDGAWKNATNKANQLRKAAKTLGFDISIRCIKNDIYLSNNNIG